MIALPLLRQVLQLILLQILLNYFLFIFHLLLEALSSYESNSLVKTFFSKLSNFFHINLLFWYLNFKYFFVLIKYS